MPRNDMDSCINCGTIVSKDLAIKGVFSLGESKKLEEAKSELKKINS